jgi:hypothetical protein
MVSMTEATSGLVAELWYAQPVDLTRPELLAALRVIAPDAEQQADSIVVPHGPATGDRPPLLSVAMAASELHADGKQRPDPSQTWDWPAAEDAVEAAQAAVLVTEMFTDGYDAEERASALGAVVRVLVEATGPVLVSWPHSQRVVDPYRETADDLDGVVNVRMFGVADDDDALVMDTLGLHVFQLPDVQCHFRDREPGEIAALLYGTAMYLFEHGDVIADGNTVSGVDGEGRYVCRREPSLIGPHREVLDVDLGDPYAAGQRDR